MKIEVSEQEARNVFSGRTATLKRQFLTILAMLAPALIFASIIAGASPDMSSWITTPIVVILMLPGFIAYIRLWNRAQKEADKQLAELKAKEEDI